MIEDIGVTGGESDHDKSINPSNWQAGPTRLAILNLDESSTGNIPQQ